MSHAKRFCRTAGWIVSAVALVVLGLWASDAVSQTFHPPADHTVQLGVPGFFTAFHKPGLGTPLDPASGCTFCHGADLKGGFAPSCYTCHGAFWDPTQPNYPDSHIIGSYFMHGQGTDPPFGRNHPFENGCTQCHGPELDGVNGIAPSCFACHAQVWQPRANQPPVADPNGPYTASIGQAIQLDGSGSTDPDGTIVAYDWDFGDGTTATGAAPTHTYAAPGTFTVTLTVTDDAGATGTADTTAEIDAGPNEPPLADPDGPYAATAGQPLVLNGTGSVDLDGTIVAYDWNFGDGGTGSGPTPTHTYAAPGLFTVTLTVTDDRGASDTATTVVSVAAADQPPVADAGGPYSGEPGQTINFDGSASFDPDGAILAYLWDFGDGSVGMGPTPSHVYDNEGNYTVTLTVADDGGNLSIGTTTAEITSGGGGPGGLAPRWAVNVPFAQITFTLTFQDMGGMLLVMEEFPDGMVLFGNGVQVQQFILWVDTEGALFMGTVDQTTGTMQGIVLNFFGTGSIWFADQLP